MKTLNYLLAAGLLFFSLKNACADDKYDNWYRRANEARSMDYCDSLINYALTLKKNALIGEAYFLKSWLSVSDGMYYLSLNSSFSALRYYRNAGLELEQADVIENIANIFRTGGYYGNALELHHDALRLKQHAEADSADIAHSYYNIGRVIRLSKNYDAAIKPLQTALGIYLRAGRTAEVSMTRNELGIVYKLAGRHAEALEHYRRLTDGYAKGTEQWEFEFSIQQNNIASLRIERGHYGEADSLLSHLIAGGYRADNSTKWNVYYNLGRIYEQKPVSPDSAIAYYNTGLAYIDTADYKEMIAGHKKLGNLYQAAGDLAQGIRHLWEGLRYAEKLAALQEELKQKSIQYQIEAATYKHRSEEIAERARRRELWIYTGLAVFLAILGGVLFFARRRRKRRRAMELEQKARDQARLKKVGKELDYISSILAEPDFPVTPHNPKQ